MQRRVCIMSGAEDAQAQRLAATNRLTETVAKQSARLDSPHANQAMAGSVLESFQRRLDAAQEGFAKHQADAAAQLKATQERLDARLAQAPPNQTRTDPTAPGAHPRRRRG